MSHPQLIAITGGIGSGKSVVSNILTSLGYTVIDTDSLAKSLMDNDDSIKHQLVDFITPDAIDQKGNIDRKAVANVVFGNPDKLKLLNSIVHGHVKTAIRQLYNNHSEISDKPLFFETALLHSSSLDSIIDAEWRVVADIPTRLARIMKRNSCSEDDALKRIRSQQDELSHRHHNIVEIVNDGNNPVLPVILNLLQSIGG